ncbi:MAG: restriction endonuclease subunit S [Microcystis sp. M179S2]|nr:restriction endonuclease subunit S [Microcystis sp. M179S2]
MYGKYDLSFLGVCVCIPCYISFSAGLSPCQLFSSFMIRVRPRTDLINPEFLSLMLRTPPMRNRLILGSNTSTITNISQPGLSKIEVVVPPIKTQNLITKVTKNIEESVRCHLQALEQSENLFNSLLQRAFRGEL